MTKEMTSPPSPPAGAVRIYLEGGSLLVMEGAAGLVQFPPPLQLGHALTNDLLDRLSQLDLFDRAFEVVVSQGDEELGQEEAPWSAGIRSPGVVWGRQSPAFSTRPGGRSSK